MNWIFSRKHRNFMHYFFTFIANIAAFLITHIMKGTTIKESTSLEVYTRVLSKVVNVS